LLGAASLFGASRAGGVRYPREPSPYPQVEYPVYQPLAWEGLPTYQTPTQFTQITGTLSDILSRMARGETTYPTEDIYRTMRLRAGAGLKEAQEALRRAAARGGRLSSGLYQGQLAQLAQAAAQQQAQIARDIALQQEQARRQAQQFAIPQYASLAGALAREAQYAHEAAINNLMQKYNWTREQAEREYASRLAKAQAEQQRLADIYAKEMQKYLQELGYSEARAKAQAEGMAGLAGQIFTGILPSILSWATGQPIEAFMIGQK